MFSCNVSQLRFTFIPENANSSVSLEQKLLLYLYNEQGVKKDIKLITDKGDLIYTSNGELKRKSQYLKLNLPENAKYIMIKYNEKRNRITLNPNYQYLYIEFKGNDFIEIVYSNEEPAFT